MSENEHEAPDLDFLTEAPPVAAERHTHWLPSPAAELVITLLWGISVHLFLGIGAHSEWFHHWTHGWSLGLPAKEPTSNEAFIIAAALCALLSVIWWRLVARHFVGSNKEWLHGKTVKIVGTLLLVFLSPPMLMALEASAVAWINGNAIADWPRAGFIACWTVVAVIAVIAFNPFSYVAEVKPDDEDKASATALVMFVSKPTREEEEDLKTLHGIFAAILETPPGDTAALQQIIDDKLFAERDSTGNVIKWKPLEHKFMQNLRGIRAQLPTLRLVRLIPSEDSSAAATQLEATIESWFKAYRHLYSQTTALPAALDVESEQAVDYDAFEKVTDQIEKTVDTLLNGDPRIASSQIVIDLTSGKKPNSAAALIYTLGRAVRAQYVRPDRKAPQRARLYDVHTITKVGVG